jgi:asparagine synthase (glutamine-hydrolysing)
MALMCGIAGIIAPELKDKDALIRKMTDVIRHRGPDDDGYWSDKNVAIGMRRLSIIDVAGGHQPMENETGNMTIVFNGEIYNFKELEADLIAKGHQFRTRCDTEALIHLYEEYGEDMLLKLRGMFAFSIYDKTKGQLFIARDYFGIKPLYYMTRGASIVAYGSEIKSLLLFPGYKPEINDDAVFNYLSYQYNPLQETMFQNIWKLPPGSYLKIDVLKEKIVEKKYWGYEFVKERNAKRGGIRENDLKKEILAGLEASVKAHMISDVPVGAFLSGGIDSAIIVALMSKNTGKKVSTFTVGFDKVSEQKPAKKMADFIKTDHTEITIKAEDFFRELPDIVWHFDEPVADPSAVGLYFLSKEARKKVTVVLSGEGADELFGGYNIYREPMALSKLNIVPKFLREMFLHPMVQSEGKFFGKNYLRRHFTKIQERYIGNAYVFKPSEVAQLWKSERKGAELLNEESLMRYDLSPIYDEVIDEKDSAKMQYIDMNTWLPGDILAKADKMTMAHSLELRVPFLDIEIAKLSERIPDKLKYKNGKTKYILRQAVKSLMPRQTASRKKLGFPTALKLWLKQDASRTKQILERVVENEYIKEHMSTGYVRHLFEDHMKGKIDNARKIYLLYMLALWHERFFR